MKKINDNHGRLFPNLVKIHENSKDKIIETTMEIRSAFQGKGGGFAIFMNCIFLFFSL